MSYKEKSYNLDAALIKETIKKMDDDVATRFVASAFSLSPKKLRSAFEIACHEMAIRNKAKAAKRRDLLADLHKTSKVKNKSPKNIEENKKAAQDVLDSIAHLFKKDDPDNDNNK